MQSKSFAGNAMWCQTQILPSILLASWSMIFNWSFWRFTHLVYQHSTLIFLVAHTLHCIMELLHQLLSGLSSRLLLHLLTNILLRILLTSRIDLSSRNYIAILCGVIWRSLQQRRQKRRAVSVKVFRRTKHTRTINWYHFQVIFNFLLSVGYGKSLQGNLMEVWVRGRKEVLLVTEETRKGIQWKSKWGDKRNLASTYKKLHPLLVTWFQISEWVEEQSGILKEFRERRLRKGTVERQERVNLVDIRTEVTNRSS